MKDLEVTYEGTTIEDYQEAFEILSTAIQDIKGMGDKLGYRSQLQFYDICRKLEEVMREQYSEFSFSITEVLEKLRRR